MSLLMTQPVESVLLDFNHEDQTQHQGNVNVALVILALAELIITIAYRIYLPKPEISLCGLLR